MEDHLEGNEITWRSPSNIALIKYWGKRGYQLPRNPSLSITLDKSFTEMKLVYYRKEDSSDIQLNFYFEEKKSPEFEEKIKSRLRKMEPYLPFLKDYAMDIHSFNSFPHSSGIASSASSMSALALCLCSMELELTARISGFESFAQKATFLARLGSGSASRSVFGGFVIWGETKNVPGSSDEFALPLSTNVHENFRNLCDSILIVSTRKKKVSSSLGHKLMEVNPYASVRYNVAKTHMAQLLEALEKGDEENFIRITEDEAMNLHAMFLTSTPGYILAQPETFEIMERIRRFREETGITICFTLDAGPNVHVIYPRKNQSLVRDFIQKELLAFCEDNQWIDDQIGTGPVQLNVS